MGGADRLPQVVLGFSVVSHKFPGWAAAVKHTQEEEVRPHLLCFAQEPAVARRVVDLSVDAGVVAAVYGAPDQPPELQFRRVGPLR